MNTLTNQDLIFVVRKLPKDVQQLLRNTPRRLYLVGGFIREMIAGNEPRDIDLIGSMPSEALRDLGKTFAEERNVKPYVTENALTVLVVGKLPVQFITRWTFNSAREAIDSLDFTVCQAAIWFEDGTWRSVCSEHFYSDLAARRLHYTYPVREEEAGGSMVRVVKFLKRGYTIQVDSLGGVIARVALKVQWNRLNGVDAETTEQAAGKVISGILREVDPLIRIDGTELADEGDADGTF